MAASESPAQPTAPVRLAELVALLSLGTDLGFGHPMEHIIRACLIALRLAERFDLSESDRVVIYYAGLLAWVGCHTDAYEQAKWFGDDLALKHAQYRTDFGRVWPATAFVLGHVGLGRSIVERVRLGVSFLAEGHRAMNQMAENHYLATDALAARLGLGAEVRDCLRQSYERWDGKGAFALRGDSILLTARLIQLADVVEFYYQSGGVDAAVAIARERSGTQFDPKVAEVFTREAPALFAALDSASGWDALLAAEPALRNRLSDEQFDDALEAIADFASIKSPWTIGHARQVADLAAAAGRDYGLAGPEVILLRRAGLVHDLGRLGVSNAIWDKPGKLTAGEIERVRLHPYLSERMLAFSPSLAPLGAIAGQHHERMDGSGYPRGLRGETITPAGRLLAAADAYQAMTEDRPHRPARTPNEAAAMLRAEATAGRLETDAIQAVLRAAGHRVTGRREQPAGLTAREVEVLRLVTYGFSNKAIARRLSISPKTAGNHIQHIYEKTGITNRAQAGLFAMKHRLLGDSAPVDA